MSWHAIISWKIISRMPFWRQRHYRVARCLVMSRRLNRLLSGSVTDHRPALLAFKATEDKGRFKKNGRELQLENNYLQTGADIRISSKTTLFFRVGGDSSLMPRVGSINKSLYICKVCLHLTGLWFEPWIKSQYDNQVSLVERIGFYIWYATLYNFIFTFIITIYKN